MNDPATLSQLGGAAEHLRPLDAAARCSICYSIFDAPLVLRTCGHSFCSGCIRQNLDFQEKAGQPQCPSCRTPCDARDLQPNVSLRELVQRYVAARPTFLEWAAQYASVAEKLGTKETSNDCLPQKRSNDVKLTGQRPVRRSRAGQARKPFARKHQQMPSAAVYAGTQRPVTRRSSGNVDQTGQGPIAEPTKEGEDSEFCVEIESSEHGGSDEDLQSSGEEFVLSDESQGEMGDADDRSDGDGDDHAGMSPRRAKKARTTKRPAITKQATNDDKKTSDAGPNGGFLPCPICNKSVPSFYINSHVDQCLLKSHTTSTEPTGPQENPQSVEVARHEEQQQHWPSGGEPKSALQKLMVPPKLVPTLVTEKSLKATLKRYCLPIDGKKPELLERYNRMRLAVETANDRGEKASYPRIAQRVIMQERQRAAANLLGGSSMAVPSTGAVVLQNNHPPAEGHLLKATVLTVAKNPTAHAKSTHHTMSEAASAIEFAVGPGASFKELIAVTRARDAARRLAREQAVANFAVMEEPVVDRGKTDREPEIDIACAAQIAQGGHSNNDSHQDPEQLDPNSLDPDNPAPMIDGNAVTCTRPMSREEMVATELKAIEEVGLCLADTDDDDW